VVGIGFSETGGVVVEEGGAFAAVEEAFEVCGEVSGEMVVGDGFEVLAGSGGAGTLFADSSRTFSKIFDVTGGFEVGFGGAGVKAFDSVFADARVVGTGGFETVFATGGGFAAGFDAVAAIGAFFVAIGVAFTGFGAAFVDFALLVDFFVSGKSTSMGSEMTFLGLPLFLTTSADMLRIELVLLEIFVEILESQDREIE
jgi:hypothetical protein